MKELIVTSKPTGVISSNIDEIKKEVEKRVAEKIDIPVNSENLKEVKSVMAGLNKVIGEIKIASTKQLENFISPIDIFKAEVKDIIAVCEKGRASLSEKVEVFNDASRLEHSIKMKDYLDDAYNENKVRSEFRIGNLPSLSIDGLTKSGELKTKSVTALDLMVVTNLQSQETFDKAKEAEERIKELEIEKKALELVAKREAEKEKTQPMEALAKTPSPGADEPIHKPRKRVGAKSVYLITRKTTTIETLEVKASQGVDSDVIIEKTKNLPFDNSSTEVHTEVVES